MDRLFYKYLAPLLVISVIPVLACGILIFFLAKSNMAELEKKLVVQNTTSLTQEISYKNEAIAKTEGQYIEQEIDRIGNKITALAISPSFISLEEDMIDAHLENLINSEPAILEMSVIDEFGDITQTKINSLSLMSEELSDVRDESLYQVLQSRQSYVSEVQISNKTQLPYILLGQPIISLTGAFEGGILVKLDLSFIWNITASKRVGDKGILFIVSKNGLLVSHPEKREIYQNADYSKYDYVQQILDMKNGTLQDDNSLFSFFTNKYGWATIIQIPVEQALASVDTNRRTILTFITATLRSISYTTVIIILLVLIMSVLSAVFIAKKIITPIFNLTQASRKIIEGDWEHKIEKYSNDEIGELTDAFNHMTADLKMKQDQLVESHEQLKRQADELLARYNSDLEQFAYVTTHDLIEPLRMITSYVQLLQRRYHEVYDEDAKEFMQYIIEGVERMHQIINDLFEYSHIRTREADFEEVNVLDAFETVVNKLHKDIQAANADINCHDLPVIRGVRTNIIQVFQNLLGNAIKFRKKDVPLEVEVFAEDRKTEWLFKVKDNGIGIEPRYSKKIFEIFKRLNKRDEYSGSGMGLAICKNIVERHGGKIWVESEPGKGATFYFTIKKQPPV